jgi:hypothetical protein
MEQDRKIRALVTDEYFITEDEQQMLLAYREADTSTRVAIKAGEDLSLELDG